MLFLQVTIAFSLFNFAVASVIYFKSRKSFASKFYFLCILFLAVYGFAGNFLETPYVYTWHFIARTIIVFIYSLIPFFFLHFIIIYIGKTNLLSKNRFLILVYTAGLFSYTMILLNLIPNPVNEFGSVSQSGYIFYLTWNSVFICLGIAILYSLFGGFADRGSKSDLLISGFIILILILPGPFAESILSVFFGQNKEYYFGTSIFALILVVYFVFRHKSVVTAYDALKSVLEVMNDIFIKTDNNLKIELVRGGVKKVWDYSEAELLGKNLFDIFINKEKLKEYFDQTNNGEILLGNFDSEVAARNQNFVIMNFSFSPIISNEVIIGYVVIGRDITLRKQTELELQQARDFLEEQVKSRTAELAKILEDLKKSEKDYKGLFENAHDAIIIFEPENEFILEANKRACEIYGFDYSEFVGMSLVEVSVNVARGKEFIRKTLETESSLNFETTHTNKKGEKIIFDINASIIDFKDKKAILSINRDITDKKKSEQILKESEYKYRTLVESMQEGLIYVDNNDEIQFVNDAACEILGYSKSELLNQIAHKLLIPEEEQNKIIDTINLRKQGVFSRYEISYKRKNGELVLLEVSGAPLFDNYDNIIGSIGILTDITIRKKAEEALQKERDQAQQYLDISGVLMIALSEEGKIILVNKKGSNILGYNEYELIGKDWFNLFIPSEIRENYKQNYFKIISGEADLIEEFENSILTKNNGRRILQFHNTLIKDKNQKNLGILFSGEDITIRKKMEEELQIFTQELKHNRDLLADKANQLQQINKQLTASEQKLIELNASKDKFFSIVAHDLKSPFHGLLGYVDILNDEFDTMSKEESKFFINNVKELTQNIFKLIDRLLDWSRLQMGKIEFEPTIINLYNVIREVVNLFYGNFTKKNIQILNNVDNFIEVSADNKMLHSIIENLISNAIKFTKAGGSVMIEAVDKNNFVQISIKDTGVGISDEDLKKLFRIDISFTTEGTNEEKGTGLGLVLCKELVEKNGGKIWVESEVGQGTIFYFTVPKI